jgi:hypothetical protein
MRRFQEDPFARQGRTRWLIAPSSTGGAGSRARLGLFFGYWRETRALDPAIRHAFGMTQSGFEERWRKQTRRRYGALAIFADLTIGAVILLFVLLPLHISRRRRDRERLSRMAAVEAAAEAKEKADAIETLLKSVGPQEDSSKDRRGLTES